MDRDYQARTTPLYMKPQRFLTVQGAHNFRDLGGYTTRSGRTIAWGRIYRSGRMSRITGSHAAELGRLRVSVICDFRTAEERHREPVTWHEGSRVSFCAHDYEVSDTEVKRIITDENADAERARRAMINVYAQLPEQQAGNYRMLFKQLASGCVPLVFSCSAGRDRTGVAAALLLAALDVPDDQIMADYLLSNEAVAGLIELMQTEPGYGKWAPERQAAVCPLLSAEPAYLEAAFASIGRDHGGLEGYLSRRLEISGAELAAVRAILTE